VTQAQEKGEKESEAEKRREKKTRPTGLSAQAREARRDVEEERE
jgi:hypothetical protein